MEFYTAMGMNEPLLYAKPEMVQQQHYRQL